MDFFKWQNYYYSLFFLLAFFRPTKNPENKDLKKPDPNAMSTCCSYPCQNGGICYEDKEEYHCDCVNTGYYGRNCSHRMWSQFFKNGLNTFLDFLLFNSLNFFVINNFEMLHTLYHSIFIENLIEKVESHYFPSTGNSYLSLTNVYNACLGTQLLPPVPLNCPTPLGNEGPKKLPSVEYLFNSLFERVVFKEAQKLNLLFVIFGQNLALQFKYCNYVTWISCSQLYSQNERTFVQGKLAVYTRQGEDYPKVAREQLGWIARGERAKANYILSENTLTFLMSTIWLREHNRVCDQLASLWPAWDDERIFQTARNIITGEMLAISYSEWVKRLSYLPVDLRYKPLRKSGIVANTVPIEVFMAFHWPHMFPEDFSIDQFSKTNISSYILALDPTQIHKHGLYKMLLSLALIPAGQMGPQNIGKSLGGVTKMLINEGRHYKLPTFNQYRSYLGLGKYNSFGELVGNQKLIKQLKQAYGTVDGMEFITGLLLESGSSFRVLGQTADHLITNWLIKAIMTHPLSTNEFWKSSTVGGKVGLEIIQSATFKDLICRNVAEVDLCYSEDMMQFGQKKLPRPRKMENPKKLPFFSRPFFDARKIFKFIN